MARVEGCLFCSIVAGEIPATIVRESELTLAFRDISPVAPTHVLVITREHYDDLADVAAENPHAAAQLLTEAAGVAADEGLVDSGWRLVSNTGEGAGQSVRHVHVHVLGGRRLSWPPG
jgi:histidine triad (HIT) family protein